MFLSAKTPYLNDEGVIKLCIARLSGAGGDYLYCWTISDSH
jgi:hypothetical protein